MMDFPEKEADSNGASPRKIEQTVDAIRELQEQLNYIFPERDTLITQFVYALLTREHVLVFGTFGTGKSLLVGRFFKALEGSSFFSIELSKYMNESNLIGMPNPKLMRDSGEIEYQLKGTIVTANLAELDEIFDANPCTLRTMLGILNERRFHRGPQSVDADLHTAVASTNADPEAEVRDKQTLGAVVDRFLLQTKVEYLESDDSRCRMFEQYLCGSKPTIQIPFADIKAVAQAVDEVRFTDLALIKLYNKILQCFKKETSRVISDRRACQALKLAKASALLAGRQEVIADDLYATMWAFVYGHDAALQKKFKEIAKPLIDKAMKEQQPDMVQTQMKLLEELGKQLPKLNGSGSNGTHTMDELAGMLRLLIKLEKEIGGIKPSTTTVAERKKQMMDAIKATDIEVSKLIRGEGVV